MNEILFIILLGVLIATSAYVSCSEIALFSLPQAKVKAYKKSKDTRQKLIAKLLEKSRDLIVTVFLVNTLVNILLQNVLSSYFFHNSWWLKVGAPFVLILILGEIIPKYIAIIKNETIAYFVSPVIDVLTNLTRPICKTIVSITQPVSRAMFFFLKKEEEMTTDELQHVVEKSKESGIVGMDEAELLSGYLHLQTTLVKELMWPKEDILFYDKNAPLTKLIHLFVDEKCTRLPICDTDLDHVLGVISSNDFLIHRDKIKEPQDILKIMVKPFYIPETTPANLAIRRFDQKNESFALVVNEYGALSGLITYEDIIEVVVGEIKDARDQNPLYIKQSERAIVASGKLELSEFNQIFHAHLESEHHLMTIGGWLVEKLGDIPKAGKKFETDDFFFQILASSPNKIKKVYILKKGG